MSESYEASEFKFVARYHYNNAKKFAKQYIKMAVEEILTEHPELDEFVLDGNTWFFIGKDENTIYNNTHKWFKYLNEFLSEWYSNNIYDEPFHITRKNIGTFSIQ